MHAGGALIVSEKIRFEDADEQAEQTDWHHDFKRTQGYSELEIAQKRNALEKVLVPDTEAEHLARLELVRPYHLMTDAAVHMCEAEMLQVQTRFTYRLELG